MKTTTKKRRSWSREQYNQWIWVWSLVGAALAFIWLGTDYWLFGLSSIVCLAFAGWSWIEVDRNHE